jgi:hypothetical protein
MTVNQPLSFQLITEDIINSQCWVCIVCGVPSAYLEMQVSTKCFLANWFAESWAAPHLEGHPNVHVFFRTVTTGVTRDPESG